MPERPDRRDPAADGDREQRAPPQPDLGLRDLLDTEARPPTASRRRARSLHVRRVRFELPSSWSAPRLVRRRAHRVRRRPVQAGAHRALARGRRDRHPRGGPAGPSGRLPARGRRGAVPVGRSRLDGLPRTVCRHDRGSRRSPRAGLRLAGLPRRHTASPPRPTRSPSSTRTSSALDLMSWRCWTAPARPSLGAADNVDRVGHHPLRGRACSLRRPDGDRLRGQRVDEQRYTLNITQREARRALSSSSTPWSRSRSRAAPRGCPISLAPSCASVPGGEGDVRFTAPRRWLLPHEHRGFLGERSCPCATAVRGRRDGLRQR